jgi:hypothetical protein
LCVFNGDASAVDLDWFFRGWFYSLILDIGINDVKAIYVSETPTKELKDVKVRKGRFGVDKGPFVYLVAESNEELKANQKKPLKVEDVKLLSDYLKTLALTKKGSFSKFF